MASAYRRKMRTFCAADEGLMTSTAPEPATGTEAVVGEESQPGCQKLEPSLGLHSEGTERTKLGNHNQTVMCGAYRGHSWAVAWNYADALDRPTSIREG